MKSFQEFLSETFINGGFNIARSEMPQLNDHIKFLSYIDSIGDIYYAYGECALDSIKPTQIDIDKTKVDAMELTEKPIIISSDFFILDGHHRYYKHLFEMEPFINTIQVDLSINKLLALAYEFLDNAT